MGFTVQEVTRYETSDGELHSHKELAEMHQRKLELRDELCSAVFLGTIDGDAIREIVEYLFRNYVLSKKSKT